jgi:hypothetical protein
LVVRMRMIAAKEKLNIDRQVRQFSLLIFQKLG